MKLRLPDPEIIRAEPRLANLSENAVYHLLMRQESKPRPRTLRVTYMAPILGFVLLLFAVLYFLPDLFMPIMVGLSGSIPTFFLLAIYSLRRVARKQLTQEFLGYTKDSVHHYALLPITPEDIVLAHWGKATFFRPINVAIGFTVFGVILIFGALARNSEIVLIAASPAIHVAGFWLGVDPYNPARSLIQTAKFARQVKQALSATEWNPYTQFPSRYEFWILGSLIVACMSCILITAVLAYIRITQWHFLIAIPIAICANLPAFALGVLTGKWAGIAAQRQMTSAMTNASNDVTFIQQVAFDRIANN